MSNQKNDLYGILGVGRDATQKELRNAYYKIAQENHTDGKNQNPERFLEASTAYNILSEPTEKEIYDKFGGNGDIYDVNFNKPPEGFVATQTETTGYKPENQTSSKASSAKEGNTTHSEKRTKNAAEQAYDSGESTTGAGWNKSYTSTFFKYFTSSEEGKVTDVMDEHKNNRELPNLDFVTKPSEESIFSFGKLHMNPADLDLMAGLVEAHKSKGPFEAVSDFYKITKDADTEEGAGKIKIEVKLGRFEKLSEGSDIKVIKTDGFGYEVKNEDTWVDVKMVEDAFNVIGIKKPLGYEGYMDKLTDMASKIASGATIDGRDIVALDTESKMCFSNERSQRVTVEASNLKTELNNRVSNWGIVPPEGTIFGQRNSEGARIYDSMSRK